MLFHAYLGQNQLFWRVGEWLRYKYENKSYYKQELMMIRKTIVINDELFDAIQFNHLLEQYGSFSELASKALQLLVEKQQKDLYKKAMIEASQDKLYLQDIYEVQKDFEYADFLEETVIVQENSK